ncbi:unnamed protein product [Prorocentrum cordatum]|uniref:Uncharacterized protein n=1 Tax=Prorocentrum cordatum TaxID=2364126 RepID=A0ABN9VLW5_9DINO|nr:unnamed protein product [Polarella glacialis]
MRRAPRWLRCPYPQDPTPQDPQLCTTSVPPTPPARTPLREAQRRSRQQRAGSPPGASRRISPARARCQAVVLWRVCGRPWQAPSADRLQARGSRAKRGGEKREASTGCGDRVGDRNDNEIYWQRQKQGAEGVHPTLRAGRLHALQVGKLPRAGSHDISVCSSSKKKLLKMDRERALGIRPTAVRDALQPS